MIDYLILNKGSAVKKICIVLGKHVMGRARKPWRDSGQEEKQAWEIFSEEMAFKLKS